MTDILRRNQVFDTANRRLYFKRGKYEKKIIELLKSLRLSFKYQYPLDDIEIVDFFLPKYNLVIEFDERYHRVPSVKKVDEEINKAILSKGYKLIRIEEDLFLKNPVFYKYMIRETIKAL